MRTLSIAVVIVGLVVPIAARAGDFSAGVALQDFDDFGLQARWTHGFPLEGARFATGATYFVDGEYLGLDADVHFRLNDAELRAFYPLLGLQLATDFDWTELGLNLGAGYGFGLTSATRAFVEGKFTFGDLDGFTATFGVFF